MKSFETVTKLEKNADFEYNLEHIIDNILNGQVFLMKILLIK